MAHFGQNVYHHRISPQAFQRLVQKIEKERRDQGFRELSHPLLRGTESKTSPVKFFNCHTLALYLIVYLTGLSNTREHQ